LPFSAASSQVVSGNISYVHDAITILICSDVYDHLQIYILLLTFNML